MDVLVGVGWVFYWAGEWALNSNRWFELYGKLDVRLQGAEPFSGLASSYSGGEAKADLDSIWMPEKKAGMDEHKEAFDKAVAVFTDGMTPEGVTPLVCERCGFTWVGHEGNIPGACGLFTATTFSVCEIRPKAEV